MSDGPGSVPRLVAWDRELIAVHKRLREALEVARDSLDGDGSSPRNDLLLYCKGFCVALSGHHVGEDGHLFPELRREHPELSGTIDALEQDHAMIATLIVQFERAIESDASLPELERHLEGIGAIMESHFRFEEKRLLAPLESFALDDEPAAVFGPL